MPKVHEVEEAEMEVAGEEDELLDKLKSLAKQGQGLSKKGEVGESYETLREISTLLPYLQKYISEEWRGEVVAEGEEDKGKGDTKGRGEEEQIDAGEARLLQGIKGKISLILGSIGKDNQRVLDQLGSIKGDIKNLTRLERFEISEETKKDLQKNYKNKKIVGLIRQETRLLRLLNSLVNEAETLVKNGGNGMIIVGIITRTSKVVDELIKINTTQIREIESKS